MPATEKNRKKSAAAKKAARPAAARPPLPARPAEPEGDGRAQKTADLRGKYVYCIIQVTEPLKFGPLGIGVEPADVHTINYRDIAAVVSDTPIEVHDPTREDAFAPDRVNETGMRKHKVIPMSFGAVFKTRDPNSGPLPPDYEG